MKCRWGGWFAMGWCALLLAGPAAAQSVELKAMNDQVNTLYLQGKYNQAMQVAQMALDIGQHDLGPDHPEVAHSLTNVAMIGQALGQNAAAEVLFKQALAILEKARGPDHPEVADALDNLAGCYKLQHKDAAAEILQERALAIRKKNPVAQSPAVVTASVPAMQNQPVADEPCVEGKPGSEPKYNDLITAVMLQDEGAVRDLLNLGKWIDVQSEAGFTPIQVAARLNDFKIAQLLLACGANPNHRNQLQLSALDYARQNKNDRMVGLLRQYGARDK